MNENPGVRPIGVEDILRRIHGKCIIKHIENELQFPGGNKRFCMVQTEGIYNH